MKKQNKTNSVEEIFSFITVTGKPKKSVIDDLQKSLPPQKQKKIFYLAIKELISIYPIDNKIFHLALFRFSQFLLSYKQTKELKKFIVEIISKEKNLIIIDYIISYFYSSRSKTYDRTFRNYLILLFQIGESISLLLEKKELSNKKKIEEYQGKITSLLSSLSNINDSQARIIILQYFCQVPRTDPDSINFNKVISRFGSTILESLLKVSEKRVVNKVASNFLLDNLMSVVEKGDQNAQKMLHDMFKNNMVDNPQRIFIILKKLLECCNNKEKEQIIKTKLNKHIELLTISAIQLKYRVAIRELTSHYYHSDKIEEFNLILNSLSKTETADKNLVHNLVGIINQKEHKDFKKKLNLFSPPRKGRRISFPKSIKMDKTMQIIEISNHL